MSAIRKQEINRSLKWFNRALDLVSAHANRWQTAFIAGTLNEDHSTQLDLLHSRTPTLRKLDVKLYRSTPGFHFLPAASMLQSMVVDGDLQPFQAPTGAENLRLTRLEIGTFSDYHLICGLIKRCAATLQLLSLSVYGREEVAPTGGLQLSLPALRKLKIHSHIPEDAIRMASPSLEELVVCPSALLGTRSLIDRLVTSQNIVSLNIFSDDGPRFTIRELHRVVGLKKLRELVFSAHGYTVQKPQPEVFIELATRIPPIWPELEEVIFQSSCYFNARLGEAVVGFVRSRNSWQIDKKEKPVGLRSVTILCDGCSAIQAQIDELLVGAST
ncbi:hypothetical protein BKA62DRAFT_299664 [Auriculariales sp. MPI-PUGE-AT-0066]|nr:hypothetical protein BKA62DRAFT_299664 [Auriculariales sp. MPI-PUGE-AT-0066]